MLAAGAPGLAVIIAVAVILVLLFVSACMSASEVALFSLNPTQLRDLKERGGVSGQRVLDLLAKPRRLLATILVVNNFALVGITVLSSIVITGLFDLDHMPDYLRFITQVVLVTFIMLLLGEVVPKVYATGNAMRVAQWMSGPLLTLRTVAGPVNEALIRSTSFIEKRYRKRGAQNIGVDALGHALELTKDASTTAGEQKILRGIVKFGAIEARQVMRPRMEVVAFDRDIGFSELLAAIVESGFSRVPVYEGTLDKIIGILHIKDVLPPPLARPLIAALAGAERAREVYSRMAPAGVPCCARPISYPRQRNWRRCSRSSRPRRPTWRWWWTSTAAPAASSPWRT